MNNSNKWIKRILLITFFILNSCYPLDRKTGQLELNQYEFINWLYAHEHLRGDSVVFLQKETDLGFGESTLNDINSPKNLDKWRNFEEGKVSDFLNQESWDLFKAQAFKSSTLDEALLDKHIKLISKEDLMGENEAEQHLVYKVISAPVLLKDGKYCGILISNQCSPIPCGGLSLYFFEKTAGGWISKASITLVIS